MKHRPLISLTEQQMTTIAGSNLSPQIQGIFKKQLGKNQKKTQFCYPCHADYADDGSHSDYADNRYYDYSDLY